MCRAGARLHAEGAGLPGKGFSLQDSIAGEVLAGREGSSTIYQYNCMTTRRIS